MSELLKVVKIDENNKFSIAEDGQELIVTVMDNGYTDSFVLDYFRLRDLYSFKDIDTLLNYINLYQK